MKKLSVSMMTVGMTYAGADLGRCGSSECPCCHVALKNHASVICVPAADKGAQGCKTIVGLKCRPVENTVDGDTVALKWRTSTVNPELTRGMVLYATHKYPRRTVSVHAGYVTLTLWVADGQGCQQIGKLPASLHLAPETIRMSINNGDWERYDSSKIPTAIGCGKYQGRKAYGV